MVTLVSTLGAGQTQTFAGYIVRADWILSHVVHVSIGPAVGPAPPQPSDIVSFGTIQVDVDSASLDPVTSDQSATAIQEVGTSFALTMTSELDLYAFDVDWEIFIRLRLPVPSRSLVTDARLILEASWSSTPEFQHILSSELPISVAVEDAASADPIIQFSNLFLRSYSSPVSRSISTPLHWGQEAEIDVQELV